jgi:hypothetical protein
MSKLHRHIYISLINNTATFSSLVLASIPSVDVKLQFFALPFLYPSSNFKSTEVMKQIVGKRMFCDGYEGFVHVHLKEGNLQSNRRVSL